MGRRLVGLYYYQERFLADFRFGLVHVRNNFEPIFVYCGERHGADQLHHRFAKVVSECARRSQRAIDVRAPAQEANSIYELGPSADPAQVPSQHSATVTAANLEAGTEF